MIAKQRRVERPLRKSEYTLLFAARQAQKGWMDLSATARGPLADSWEFLTSTPLEQTLTNYPLKDDLGTVAYQGSHYQRWQHKPTLKGSARIWFFIDGQTVYLEQVFTAHPHQTK